jgi:hypothetical protein
MNPLKIVGIVLLVGGIIALATGGFSYTKETHKADIGPVHVAVAETHDVNVPFWAGVAAVVAGVVLVALPKR